MDMATARTALTYVSHVVDAERRSYIGNCLLRIKDGEDPLEKMCAAGHQDQTGLMRFLIEGCRGDVNYKNIRDELGYTMRLVLDIQRPLNCS